MAAILDRKIAEDHVGAILEGYCLVGCRRGPGGVLVVTSPGSLMGIVKFVEPLVAI